MNQILTLQQISDIDTLTLQQKIEEMQQHPLTAMYEQLIAIARLELVERYKVEEFGRMLINGEIGASRGNEGGEWEFEFGKKDRSEQGKGLYATGDRQSSNASTPAFTTVSKNKLSNIVKSQRKIDYSQFLKKSLVPEQEVLMIGKPALGNYRYVSTKKQKQKKSSNKQQKKPYNTITQPPKRPQIKKKSNSIKPPISIPPLPNPATKQKNISNTQQSQRNRVMSVKQERRQVLQCQAVINKQVQKQGYKQKQMKLENILCGSEQGKKTNMIKLADYQIQQPQPKQPHPPNHPQPPKPKPPQIRYIQNDVYELQKLILDKPQKLADISLSSCSQTHQSEGKDQLPEEQEESWRQAVIEEEINVEGNGVRDGDGDGDGGELKQEIIVRDQQGLQFKELIFDTMSSHKPIKNNQTFQLQEQLLQSPSTVKKTNQNHEIKPEPHNQQSRTTKNSPAKDHHPSTLQPQQKQKQLKDLKLSLPHTNSSTNTKAKLNTVQNTNVRPMMGPSKSSRTVSLCQNLDGGGSNGRQQDVIIFNPGFTDKQSNKNSTQQNPKNQKIAQKTLTTFSRTKKFHSTTQPTTPLPSPLPPIPTPPPTFPYHEITPTFARLFPHSPSLLNDLRSIEKQLQDHLSKNINQISLNDEYLRIRENELMWKLVSECEKAQRYRHVFGIELESFQERGRVMMQRIRDGMGNTGRKDDDQGGILLYRVIRQKEDVYDIINNSFHRTTHWYQLPHGMDLKTSWNLLWTWSKPQIDIKQLFYFQKVNHFFGNKQIARKDLLKKNIQKIKKLGPKAKAAFDIIPQTYFLPGENMQFVRKFREYSVKAGLNYWIMKPVGLSRGRGIQLITKIEDVVFSQPVVVQKYLWNPLLLGGYKFDMRIYVLVTSINPLEAYVYKEGFARISTEKYSLQEEDVHNKFVHLTNFSVQKQNMDQEDRVKQISALTAQQKQIGGCKITLKSLQQKLQSLQIAWQPIQSQIDSIVLKSLISTMTAIPPNPNCFQLFGYDIIIDQDLKCWLIEVNASPSLEKDYTIDEIVKQQLVDDVVDVVAPVCYDRSRLLEVVGRRRREMEGLKSHINTWNNSIGQLDADLHYILHGKKIRKYGEPVDNQNFRRIAPGDMYQNILKTVQQYKLSSITKQQQF